MRKNSNSKLITCMILILLLSISVIFTGCERATLESYVNENETFKKEIESYSAAGLTMTISDNTLSYSYAYDQSFDDVTIDLLSTQLEEALDPMAATFSGVKDALVEETGISEIVVKVIYTDKNNAIIYEKEY